MNPQTLSKPVMDVSAPRPMQQPPAAADAIAVQPAPAVATAPGQPKTTPVAAPASKPEAERPQANVHRQPSGAPVGVITVALLAMMVLSAAAVIVYVTSNTA